MIKFSETIILNNADVLSNPSEHNSHIFLKNIIIFMRMPTQLFIKIVEIMSVKKNRLINKKMLLIGFDKKFTHYDYFLKEFTGWENIKIISTLINSVDYVNSPEFKDFFPSEKISSLAIDESRMCKLFDDIKNSDIFIHLFKNVFSNKLDEKNILYIINALKNKVLDIKQLKENNIDIISFLNNNKKSILFCYSLVVDYKLDVSFTVNDLIEILYKKDNNINSSLICQVFSQIPNKNNIDWKTFFDKCFQIDIDFDFEIKPFISYFLKNTKKNEVLEIVEYLFEQRIKNYKEICILFRACEDWINKECWYNLLKKHNFYNNVSTYYDDNADYYNIFIYVNNHIFEVMDTLFQVQECSPLSCKKLFIDFVRNLQALP